MCVVKSKGFFILCHNKKHDKRRISRIECHVCIKGNEYYVFRTRLSTLKEDFVSLQPLFNESRSD